MQTLTHENKNNKLLLFVFFAALTSIAAVASVSFLEFKWAIVVILGLAFPFVLAMVPDTRRFILWILVFTFPLNIDANLIWTQSPSGSSYLGIRLMDILVIILFILLMFQTGREKSVRSFRFFPHISLPTLALIMFSGISMLVAPDLKASLIEIVNYLKLFIFFIVFANSIRNREDLATVVNALFLSIIVQVALVAMQYYEGSALGLHMVGLGESPEVIQFEMEASNIARPGGTVGLCNAVARYFAMILPISIVLALVSKSNKMLWLARITSNLGLVGIIYTLTRSAWIGLVVAMIFVILVLVARRLTNMRVMANIAAGGFILAIVLLFFGQMIYNRIVLDDYGSALTRITTAKVSFKVISDYPLLGVGINNYKHVLPIYWDVESRFTRIAGVHNTYLQYVAEIGIIGFIAYLWLMIAAYTRIQHAIKSHSDFMAAVAVGIFGGFLSFAVTALAGVSNKTNHVVMASLWLLLAIIEAIITMNEKYENTAEELLIGRKWLNEL
ncbi:O-antigen ligase family protein [candidate division KSB1 bacterium]|nr:O-antigen ligase family protein [candidate division KSB1 bacterium]